MDKMITFTIAHDRQFVRLEIDGRITISDLVESRKALISALHNCTRDKVLIDARKGDLDISTDETRQLASSPGQKLFNGLKVAVIVQLQDWEIATTVEKIVNNSNSSIRMRVFRDEIYACAWLGIRNT